MKYDKKEVCKRIEKRYIFIMKLNKVRSFDNNYLTKSYTEYNDDFSNEEFNLNLTYLNLDSLIIISIKV